MGVAGLEIFISDQAPAPLEIKAKKRKERFVLKWIMFMTCVSQATVCGGFVCMWPEVK